MKSENAKTPQSGRTTRSRARQSKPKKLPPESMIRVHLTLTKDVLEEPDRVEHLKHQLVHDFELRDVNEKRLLRYGIVSGELPESKLEAVRKLSEVESLDVDQMRRALN